MFRGHYKFFYLLCVQFIYIYIYIIHQLVNIVFSYLKVLGSVGHPIKDTEFKIVDQETGTVLPPGSKGIVKVRGPPVMRGYYKVKHYHFLLIFQQSCELIFSKYPPYFG